MRLGTGVAITNVSSRGSGAASFDSDYQAVLTYGTSQGWTLPSMSNQIAQNSLMVALKSANVLATSDILYVTATDGDQDFACINWKSPGTYTLTRTNSPIFMPMEGFSSDGVSSFLTTNWNPLTNGVNFTQNSASRSFWLYNSTTGAAAWLDGTAATQINRVRATSAIGQRINQNTDLDGVIDTSGAGWRNLVRTAASGAGSVVGYQNTTATARAANSVAPQNESMFLFRTFSAYNNVGTIISFYACGGTFDATKNTAAYNAVNTYVSALPGNLTAPVISGTGFVGQTLTTTNGTWGGSPSFTYQWRRNGSNISGATSSTYVLQPADDLTSITCAVTATTSSGANTVVSNSISVANNAMRGVAQYNAAHNGFESRPGLNSQAFFDSVRVPRSCSSLAIEIHPWYVHPTDGAQVEANNVNLSEVSIICPNGVAIPIFYSGSRAKSMPNTDIYNLSTEVYPGAAGYSQFPAGTYTIKGIVKVPTAGQAIPFSQRQRADDTTLTQFQWFNDATSFPSSTDASGKYTFTGAALEGERNQGFSPLLFGRFMDDTGPSWISLVDSIGTTTGDIANGIFGRSWLNRAMQANDHPNMNFGRSGTTANALTLTAFTTKIAPFLPAAKQGFVAVGTNDIGLGAPPTAATVTGKLSSIYTMLSSAGITLITGSRIIPRTQSTDSWATTGNQTPYAGFVTAGVASQVDDWVIDRRGDRTLTMVVDNYSIRDTDKTLWIVNGSPFYSTTDGTHPSPAGHALLSTENAPKLLSGTIDVTAMTNFHSLYDTSITSLITQVAGAISSWSPVGSGGAISQGTGANQPTINTNLIGNIFGAYFDGVNDGLTGGSGLYNIPNGDFTWYVVYDPNVTGKDTNMFELTATSNSSRFRLDFSDTQFQVRSGTATETNGGPTWTSDTNMHVYKFSRSGVTLTAMRDLAVTYNSNIASSFVATAFRLGGFVGGTAIPNGTIGTVLVFNGTVSGANDTLIRQRIAGQWS